MDESIAYALAARGVSTQDDLAELAADEISDIDGMGMERASALILAARAVEIARLEKLN
jgi:N utilization substance protein A